MTLNCNAKLAFLIELNGLNEGCIDNKIAVLKSSMPHRLLDAQEAAQILRMDRRTLILWARMGYVPAHPLGEGKRKMWRFLEHELLEWVEARECDKKRPPTSTIKVSHQRSC